MIAARLLRLLVPAMLGGCAPPAVLSRPLPSPTMELPTGTAMPMPGYAVRADGEPAVLRLDREPSAAPPAAMSPRRDAQP